MLCVYFLFLGNVMCLLLTNICPIFLYVYQLMTKTSYKIVINT